LSIIGLNWPIIDNQLNEKFDERSVTKWQLKKTITEMISD